MFPTVNLNNPSGMRCSDEFGFCQLITSVFTAYIGNPEENCGIYFSNCCKCWLDVSNGHEIQTSHSGQSGNIKWLEVDI